MYELLGMTFKLEAFRCSIGSILLFLYFYNIQSCCLCGMLYIYV